MIETILLIAAGMAIYHFAIGACFTAFALKSTGYTAGRLSILECLGIATIWPMLVYEILMRSLRK